MSLRPADITWALLYSLIEKAFIVFLPDLRGGFYVPAVMDSIIIAWSVVYFASLRPNAQGWT